MLRHGIWLELRQMLHVALSCLCWPSKDGLAKAKGQTRCWCNMRSSGSGGGSRRNTCFRLLVDSCTKKPLHENAPRKKAVMSKEACMHQNQMAQNAGFRHLEKGIWSNSLQTWSCNSHGPANTKYTFDCKLRSEEPPGRMFMDLSWDGETSKVAI